MLHKLNILQIEQIRIQQTSEFIFKCMSLSFVDFFSLTSQSNPYNVEHLPLIEVATRTNTRKFSIKSAGPRTWNNLPVVAIRNSSPASLCLNGNSVVTY